MAGNTLSNGFSDIEVPVVDGGTNDSTTLSLTFNGVDQGAKGSIDPSGTDGAITAWVKINDASRAETFRLRPRESGYKALPAAITIDGVTVQPSIRLEGEDASATSWDDVVNSNAFAIAGTGSDPTFDENTPGIDCSRVKFNGAKYYRAATASVGALSTNDFVIELIYKHDATTVDYMINRVGPAGVTDSILIYPSGTGLFVYLDPPSGSPVTVTAATGLVAGAWYHVMLFVDRSGNAQAYVNAAAGTAAAISAFAADNLSADGRWALGARSETGSNATQNSISYFSLWHRAAWLATSTQAGVAAERFARCCGVYAETAAQLNPGFVDLDFETAGVGSWTAAGGATLTKESGARTGGAGSLVLRVAGDGSTATARAVQVVAMGVKRVTGWSRSNGVALPTLYLSGYGVWQGTTSTSWQYFDVTVKSYYYTFNQLWCGVAGVTAGYVEWDDITIEVDGAIPTTRTRSTIAHLEKWNAAETESYLIPVGPNWIRTDKIKTQDGSFKTGVRIENGQTNRFLYSEDFSQANWTATRVTIGTPATGLGALSFDAVIASADDDTHYLTQAVTTAASESHSVSIYAKAGAVNSIKLELNEDTTQYAYFNLSTGAVGDTGAGFTLSQPAHIYDRGNGYYRCEIRPTTAGATATINIYASDGSTDGSETFEGDASTVSVYLAAAQFERYVSATQQSGSLTSYVKTTTAAASRVKDILTYHGYENCTDKDTQNITAKVDYVCPVYVSGYTGFRNFGAWGATNANDRMELYRADSTDKAVALVTASSISQALLSSATAPMLDGDEQTIEVLWEKDNVNIILGQEVDATDSSAYLPRILQVVVGASTAYAAQLDGLITDFVLSPYGTIYPRAIFALDKTSVAQSVFVAYEPLDDEAETYELVAAAGTTRDIVLRGGTLNAGTWYLISLEWDGGTSLSLKVNGVEVDSVAADATIATQGELFIALSYPQEVA